MSHFWGVGIFCMKFSRFVCWPFFFWTSVSDRGLAAKHNDAAAERKTPQQQTQNFSFVLGACAEQKIILLYFFTFTQNNFSCHRTWPKILFNWMSWKSWMAPVRSRTFSILELDRARQKGTYLFWPFSGILDCPTDPESACLEEMHFWETPGFFSHFPTEIQRSDVLLLLYTLNEWTSSGFVCKQTWLLVTHWIWRLQTENTWGQVINWQQTDRFGDSYRWLSALDQESMAPEPWLSANSSERSSQTHARQWMLGARGRGSGVQVLGPPHQNPVSARFPWQCRLPLYPFNPRLFLTRFAFLCSFLLPIGEGVIVSSQFMANQTHQSCPSFFLQNKSMQTKFVRFHKQVKQCLLHFFPRRMRG